ncbi:hypothetical protein KC19_VG020700 [Ceratodon purpureus]|uniref:Uncharacterized protein n=1 Tax=Ceratodon purpureus TaxID=3225 RepID=A0A8T0HL80_CERPU|nr:hypothetical protein KC19_VG020700 [Ceratodon purpureus]
MIVKVIRPRMYQIAPSDGLMADVVAENKGQRYLGLQVNLTENLIIVWNKTRHSHNLGAMVLRHPLLGSVLKCRSLHRHHPWLPQWVGPGFLFLKTEVQQITK